MARPSNQSRLESRSARLRLEQRPEPYWVRLAEGCYLGYRRSRRGAGRWIGRHRDVTGRQEYRKLGTADDTPDSPLAVLTFDQAQQAARDWFRTASALAAAGRGTGPYTVAACMADYLDYLRTHRRSAGHVETYAKAFILPELGELDTAQLTTAILTRWQRRLASELPRDRSGKGLPQRSPGRVTASSAVWRCATCSWRRASSTSGRANRARRGT